MDRVPPPLPRPHRRPPTPHRVVAVSTAVILSTGAVLVAVPAHADPAPAAEPTTGIPASAPPAAHADEPALPAAEGWPFSEAFSRTSGTSRYDAGALLWSDWLYDDTGAGNYTYADAAAGANGADVFRAAVATDGEDTYWRVDWNTLIDPDVPIAAWTFDTDRDEATGTATWPASAGVQSAGIDAALVVSSRGAWWTDTETGAVTDLETLGGRLTVDTAARSFIVSIPRSTLPVEGVWTTRLAAGIADESGTAFAASPEAPEGTRVYNAAFRDIADEPILSGPDASTQWNNRRQSELLTGGDVAEFSIAVDWARLAAQESTPEPQPRGYSTRWYVSSADLGQGMDPAARRSPGPALQPATFFGRVQPYTVFVPESYTGESAVPLTILLHGGDGNHNAFIGEHRDAVFVPMCAERGSICVMPLGRGLSSWYINEAELDVWEVWSRTAAAFLVDADRTVIGGFSMGGVGATHIVTNHPDVFSAAVIVSGAGYFNTAGQRDREGAPLRAENLGSVRTFIDSGSRDVALANTRIWDATMQEAAVPYRAHYYEDADHGMLGSRIGWADAAEYVASAPPREHAPASVVFRWEPGDERADLGLPVDSAYWLSELSPRDGEARWSRVSATAGALDTVDWRAVLTDEQRSLGDGPAQVRDQQRVTVGERAPRDEIEVAVENVATATVDLDAAGADVLASTTMRVTSDGDLRLALTRAGAREELPLPAGDSEIASPSAPDAVEATTADGVTRLTWSASASALPVTGYTVRDANGVIVCETTGTSCETGATVAPAAARAAADEPRFAVTATSILGTSAPAWSAEAGGAPVPAPTPGAPGADPVAGDGAGTGAAPRAGSLAATGVEPLIGLATAAALLLAGLGTLAVRRAIRTRS